MNCPLLSCLCIPSPHRHSRARLHSSSPRPLHPTPPRPSRPLRHSRARLHSSSPTFLIGDPVLLLLLFFLDAGSGSGMTTGAFGFLGSGMTTERPCFVIPAPLHHPCARPRPSFPRKRESRVVAFSLIPLDAGSGSGMTTGAFGFLGSGMTTERPCFVIPAPLHHPCARPRPSFPRKRESRVFAFSFFWMPDQVRHDEWRSLASNYVIPAKAGIQGLCFFFFFWILRCIMPPNGI